MSKVSRVLGVQKKQTLNPVGYKFEKLKNPHNKNSYVIRLSVPEFTSICPVTRQPDFAYIIIDYIPNNWIVESKSFKLYINSYRNYGIFHEDVTLKIVKSLKASLSPKWIRIAGFFAPRGGIPIDVFWQSSSPPKTVLIPEYNFPKLNFINR